VQTKSTRGGARPSRLSRRTGRSADTASRRSTASRRVGAQQPRWIRTVRTDVAPTWP